MKTIWRTDLENTEDEFVEAGEEEVQRWNLSITYLSSMWIPRD